MTPLYTPSRQLLTLTLTLTLLSLPRPCAAATSPASGEFDCAAYNPKPPDPQSRGCLARLNDVRADYDRCRDSSTTTCYIFLQEPPFITLNRPAAWNASPPAQAALQKPFRCGDFESVFRSVGGLSGIAFNLHNLTASADDLCMWGGHASSCTFNTLVDYTAAMASRGYRFAITGLLLELPARQCLHHASAPFVDNSMIVIGKKTAGSVSSGALDQLTRPFHWGAWAIFAAVILLFACVCVAIAVRFHVVRRRSLITAFFIFTGDRQEAVAHEIRTSHADTSHAISFATKYGLAITLYRLAVIAFLGIFVLFYEVAVVNFLFLQQSLILTKSVQSLSTTELTAYSVLQNSALENVWAATVSAGRPDPWQPDRPPWNRCPTATQCIRDADKGRTQFVITFEIVGKYLLLTESNCDALTIFETKDIIYQFNAGWLYNNKTSPEKRNTVDRQLVGLRIDGTTRQLIDTYISDFSCENAVKSDIGPMIILIPVMIFVFPPLLVSILVLFCWKRTKPRLKPDQSSQTADPAQTLPSGSETGLDSSWSSAL